MSGRDLSTGRRSTQHLAAERLSAERLAERLGELVAKAERIAHSFATGSHGRRRAGPGERFWQFRAYGPEDPAASIDWRQSARGDALFVREREWEAAQSLFLWCDLSGSMRFGAGPTKVERSLVIGLALAFAALEGGERVAWLGGGERARGGALGRARLLAALEAALRASDGREDDLLSSPPDVALPKRAKVVAISDFLVAPERALGAIRRWLAGDVEAGAMQIVDPVECAFPYRGRLRVVGSEGEGEQVIGDCASVREAYLEAFEAHGAWLKDQARRVGWPFVRHVTDQPAAPAAAALHRALADGGARAARRRLG